MPISRLTYTYIETGGAECVCAMRIAGNDAEPYLRTHANSLLERARSGASPEASFVDEYARQRFDLLAEGSPDEFLDAATSIANDIQEFMDHRTKGGLLVAAGLVNDRQEHSTLVLKLEVAERFSGILKQISAGQVELSVVRDRMTGAKDLQKGALAPDPRNVSAVVVGDKLPETAEYFLNGLGVVQYVKPSHAVQVAYRAMVGRSPDRSRAAEVAEALQKERPASLDTFIDAHPDLFDPEGAAAIRAEISRGPHPIRALDPNTAAAAKRIIRVAGVTISGALADIMNSVQTNELPDGRWRIVIESDSPPEIRDEF